MPKYRFYVEFEANDIDEAWEEAGQYCDWGGQPNQELMEKENMKLIEIEDSA